MKQFRFKVAFPDKFHGFDFGGEEIAHFKCSGDAAVFAAQLAHLTDKEARVVTRRNKRVECIFTGGPANPPHEKGVWKR